jgi:hypothetical protein
MTVEGVADRFYEVHSQSGSTYEIELQTGACTCPDCQQRGDQYVCKHTIRASLVETIAEGVTTRPVAKVAGYARDPDHGCPTEGHGGECAGPLAGNGRLPCPTCCDATRSEETDDITSGTESSRPIETKTASRTRPRSAPIEPLPRPRGLVSNDRNRRSRPGQ